MTAQGHRSAIAAVLRLLDGAFEGTDESLLTNLRGVSQDEWWAVPPGGGRSIADILEHVGWAKWMYEDYGFGDGSLRGDVPPVAPAGGRPRPRDELLQWLIDGHHRLQLRLGELPDDSELDRPRFVYGLQAPGPTIEIFRILIGSDFYHAGEVNHVRALLQGNDRWPY